MYAVSGAGFPDGLHAEGRRRCHSVIITRPLNPGPGRSLHDRHSAVRQHLQNWVICVHPATRPTQQSATSNRRSGGCRGEDRTRSVTGP